MPLQIVIGAGSTGFATASQLAEGGEQVRLISRRGRGPAHPLVDLVAADALDVDRLSALTRGAATVFNCAMPAYDRWPTDWPPLAHSLLTAAERAGANYVMLGNLYGYGHVDGSFTEDLPMAPTTVKGRVRAQMWNDALAAYKSGRVRVSEVRASDFLGAGAVSLYTLAVLPAILTGERAAYPADLDAPHSWTGTEDAARTLIAASRSERSWGRAWHVPSITSSVGELTQRFAQMAGTGPSKLERVSALEFDTLSAANPIFAEVREVLYLLEGFRELDSKVTQRELGLEPSPIDDVVASTVSGLTR
jgi:nucleoside-diphosphate-sugar epimerase